MKIESLIIKALGIVVPWTLRWYYTPKRISALIDVTIPSTGDGFTYNGASGKAVCWLEITNRSPFDFIADRILIDINMNGNCGTMFQIIPTQIKAGCKERMFASVDSIAVAAHSIQQLRNEPKVWLTVHAVLQCKVRDFVYYSSINDLRNMRIFNLAVQS